MVSKQRKWSVLNSLAYFCNTMVIRDELENFYDEQAKFREVTRRKHRPEFDYILEQVEKYPKDTIRLVELGCGDGRLFRELQEKSKKTIIYTGVDISQGLLDIAKEKSPNAEWIHAAMEEYLTQGEQESVDIFVSVASFHHLADKKTRLLTLINIYRLLQYSGIHISFNRALSNWFIKKMRKSVLKARGMAALSFGKKSRNDIMVPFHTPTKDKTFMRYYHMFNLEELAYLTRKTGFILRELCYIATTGDKTMDRRNARNSLLIQEKNVSEDEGYQRK